MVYLAVPQQFQNEYYSSKIIKQSLKGEVEQKEIKYPKDLGEAHPYNFADIDKIMTHVGLAAGIVNKTADAIIGDFSVKVENPNAQKLLDEFIDKSNFLVGLRPWVVEGLCKGNGFMEPDLEEYKVRTLNANNIFSKRTKKGKLLYYNQYLGNFKEDRIRFEPNQLAHLKINCIADSPYGLGILYPSERVIENIVNNDQDLQKLIARKAGQPIHVKIGIPGEVTPTEAIDEFSERLKFMNNKTEWVTDMQCEMSTPLDFKEMGANLTETNMYFFRQLLAGTEIPEVMMGSGQLNEGIAKVQKATFKLKIQKIREIIEDVIEEQIFKPLLNKNKFDEQIEFTWEAQDQEQINLEITMIKDLLTSNIGENTRRALEIKLCGLMDLGIEDLLRPPEAGLDDKKEKEEKDMQQQEMDAKKPKEEPAKPKASERQKEENIPQPEIPGAKPNAKEEQVIEVKEKVCDCEKVEELNIVETSGDMTVKEWANLKELAGFNYSDYLIKILQVLRVDKFQMLSANNIEEVAKGLLSKEDIEKLRLILKDGFRKNKTILEIEKELKENIYWRDRETKSGSIIPGENRPNMVARTETVRLSNEGLKALYKENNVDKVRFLAALSDRTCPICEGLNGQIFELDKLVVGDSQPPIHTDCRCSLVGLI